MQRYSTPLLAALLGFAVAVPPVHSGSRNLVGLNGQVCAFETIADAIANASRGDTILATSDTYAERLAIGLTIELHPAESDCQENDPNGRIVLDGASLPAATLGGLVEVHSRASVTFSQVDIQNGSAQQGGLVAVRDGSRLTLKDSTLSGGTATQNGGCAYVEEARLDLEDSTASGCTAPAGSGGGVLLVDSTLDLAGPPAAVDTNTAEVDGGGIHALRSTVSGSGCSLLGNTATTGDGGGIWAEDSAIHLDSCELSLNQAAHSGGGLFVVGLGSSLDLATSTLSFNQTTTSATNEGGGAVYTSGALSLSLTGSFVVSNTSDNLGGGIEMRNGVQLTAVDSQITDNIAAGPGGGIYASQSASSIDLDAVTIARNSSSSLGGGLYAVFTNLAARRSSFDSNAGDSGGGAYLWLNAGVVQFDNVRWIGNSAEDDGGAAAVRSATMTLAEVLDGPAACDTGSLAAGEHCAELSGNSASRGGALAASDATVTLTGAWVEQNTSTASGGGIWGEDVALTLVDTVLDGNQTGPTGGGIHLVEGPDSALTTLSMTGGRISSNQATTSGTNQGGGGLYLDNVDATIAEALIDDNSAPNSGGALHGRSGSSVALLDTIVTGNSSTGASGGAFYMAQSASSLTLEKVELTANTASSTGGGIQATFTPVVARDSLVAGNGAHSGGGAYLRLSSGNLLENVLVIGNTAEEEGGGIYLNDAGLTLRSLFIGAGACDPASRGIDEYCAEMRGNTAGISGGGIYLTGNDTSSFADPRLFADGVAFIGNQASTRGAALAQEDSSADADSDGPAAQLTNVLIKDSGDAAQVAALWLGEDATLLIDGATVAGNSGAPVEAENNDFDLTLRNTILWNNGVGPYASFDGALSRDCTNSEPSQPGGRFFGSGVDPAFITTARGPHRLDPATSPLIDGCSNGPLFDLDGGVRPGRTSWDLGAFEVEALPLSTLLFSDGFESGDTAPWSSGHP